MTPLGVSAAFLGYALAFAVAAGACFAALGRAIGIEDADTRRGLVGLLLGSGGWAGTQLLFLLAPTRSLGYVAYQLSLVVGLTTVGAWLYFCSAYTGRQFHRNSTYRRLAVAIYLGIVAVKLTNPLHGLYFSTEFVTTPFPHQTVHHETFHWLVSGLSYALVAVGFFMLYELFLEADYDTRPLGALVGITGLPVLLDVLGFATPYLIDINYEPLGVAAFALGTLYLFEERFLAVQLTDGVDDPVVYLDDDGRVREFNGRARDLFPALDGAAGSPLESVLPDVAATLEGDDRVLELTRDGETRYYLVSDTSFSLRQADVGRLVVFTDVTETERRRRELGRQNEQLEGFAAAIRHELLNTLQIVQGRVNVAGERLDDGDVATARESLRTASETTGRMSDIVDDLATLARQGQTLSDTDPVPFADAAEAAWQSTKTDDCTFSVDRDGTVEADATRLRTLLQNAVEFLTYNDASTVTATLREDGFVVAGDARLDADADDEDLFAYGTAVPNADAGMTLPNLRMIAEVHGWDVTLETDDSGGMRLLVSNASTSLASDASPAAQSD